MILVKKGDIEMDMVVKIILGIVGLLLILYIIVALLPGEFANQSDKAADLFS